MAWGRGGSGRRGAGCRQEQERRLGGQGWDWIVAVADAEMGHPDSAEGERRGEERGGEEGREREREPEPETETETEGEGREPHP